MPRRPDHFRLALLIVIAVCPTGVYAQFGGGMGGGGGNMPDMGGFKDKPAFREIVQQKGGIKPKPKETDVIVQDVTVSGNSRISTDEVFQKLQTRKDRFYDFETVLADIRRLHELFEFATYELREVPGGIAVHFKVRERPSISRVVYHGNRAINERDLKGRSGVNEGDPLNEFSLESARRRLLDYYREEGFNQATVATVRGIDDDMGAILFRINEGPKERIASIQIKGNSIVSEARLKKVIKSRDATMGVLRYLNNKANLSKIDEDVQVLQSYYHNLGFLTASVGRSIDYDASGKWLNVTFIVDEGVRYSVNDVKIVGNRYIETESLRERLSLKPGDYFNGTLLRKDIAEIVYGYGSFGFIYAEVKPQTVMRDENDRVDLVYTIEEGDRWKIRNININIDGEPHLMKDTTLLNQIDLVEGEFIDRRTLELNRARIERMQLLETNPAMAEPPDIKVVPVGKSEEDDY
jgi:outer membrane protein insertion porin family